MISQARFPLFSPFFGADDFFITSHRFVANTAHHLHPFIIPRLQMQDGGCSPSRSLTPAGCSFSSIAGLIRVAVAACQPICASVQPDVQISPIHPPHSLASVSWRIFAPCEESDSHMVLISNARGAERAATAVHLPPGMSVQPDILIFVSAPPPSSAKVRKMFFRLYRGSNLCMQLFRECEGSDEPRQRLVHSPFALLPRLQRRVGGFSPNARSLTPAGCFLLGDRHVCSTRSAVLSPCWVSIFHRYT